MQLDCATCYGCRIMAAQQSKMPDLRTDHKPPGVVANVKVQFRHCACALFIQWIGTIWEDEHCHERLSQLLPFKVAVLFIPS